MKRFFRTLSVFLFVVIFHVAAQEHFPRHVLLIGIDGISTEGFQFSSTPAIRELIRQGTLSITTRCVMPSVSAPNWATILSGMGPEQHGVTNNEWSANNYTIEPIIRDQEGYIPTIFTAIRETYPDAKTGFFHDWDWLGSFVNSKSVSVAEFTKGHPAITARAAQFIKEEKPLFTFVYYGWPDGVAHRKGHGSPEYLEAIHDIDSDIATLVAALKESGTYDKTNIVIVSDHGFMHKEHGGESMLEMEVPWLVAGPGIRKNFLLEQPNDAMNTTPTIAALLGIEARPEWIGRTVGAVFAAAHVAGVKMYVPKPSCIPGSGVTLAPTEYTLSTPYPDAAIHYTLDGSDPDEGSALYKKPLTLDKSVELRAACFEGGGRSRIVSVKNVRVKGIRSVSLANEPAEKYHGIGGALSLVDGITASTDFHDKNWLGFEGKDLDAEIVFDEVRDITSISVRCLSENRSWIYLPPRVEFYAPNGKGVYEIIGIGTPDASTFIGTQIVTFSPTFPAIRSDRVKVFVRSPGVCPVDKPGAGYAGWLFVDEVSFRIRN